MKIDIEGLKAQIASREKEISFRSKEVSKSLDILAKEKELLKQAEIEMDKPESCVGKYYKVGAPNANYFNYPTYFLPSLIRDGGDVFIGLYLDSSSTEPINTKGGVNKVWLAKGIEITPKEFWEKFDKIVEGIKAQYCVVWKNE